jgi:hypothetical protein
MPQAIMMLPGAWCGSLALSSQRVCNHHDASHRSVTRERRKSRVKYLESVLYAVVEQNQEVIAKFRAQAAESTTCRQDTPVQ